MREVLAWQEVEKLAGQIDWDSAVKRLRPPQTWFDDNADPFAPEEPAP